MLSTHEMRRRAPLHYEAKADNARFVAYLLDQGLCAECTAQIKAGANYGGTPKVALYEAFRREAALALELIVKAVIAQRIEAGNALPYVVSVRPTHDVPKLWQEAGLPTLSNEDRRRLVKVKEILIWSGRYAAPRTDAQFELLEAEDEALKPPKPPGKLFVHEPTLIDWPNFDRLYQIAHAEFWRVREKFWGR